MGVHAEWLRLSVVWLAPVVRSVPADHLALKLVSMAATVTQSDGNPCMNDEQEWADMS